LSAPVGLDRPTAALVAVAPGPTPDSLAQDLLAQLEIWRARYADEGFEPVRSAWLERGPEPDEHVATTFNGRVIEGAFAGLASSGGLRLDTPTGPRTIMTGELF
jgi:BirA family biotin operon repressor/biotin-[acetyl-CoA-carboxylase] ligase